MTAEVVAIVAVTFAFASFCVCLWCVLSMQRQMEDRMKSIVILLRSKDMEEATNAMDAMSVIEKREAKRKIQEHVLQMPVRSPEEVERDMVGDAAKQYADTDLDRPFSQSDT